MLKKGTLYCHLRYVCAFLSGLILGAGIILIRVRSIILKSFTLYQEETQKIVIYNLLDHFAFFYLIVLVFCIVLIAIIIYYLFGLRKKTT